MNIEENIDSSQKVIPLKDKETLEENKENATTDLVYIPKFNYLNGKKTYWSQDLELDLILNQYKNIHILDKNSLKKAKWSSEEDKVFTPPPVTSIPKNIDIITFENLLRKSKLAEIEKKISTGNFIDEETDNDKDLRSPSPEPIYDPRSGQRINTREIRNKEKFMKQKNQLIAELIQLDDEYTPPHGYKPPKVTHKIYIMNNEKYLFTRYILGNKGENLRRLQNLSKCKINIRGEGGGWVNSTNSNQIRYQNKPKEALHLFVEADNEETLQKGIDLILPYLNEKYCGDKGHPSMDCPFMENLKNKNLEEINNKKDPKDIQNSILFKGINKSNLKNDNKNPEIKKEEVNNLFGDYETSLVNNYAKFLAANANKNKLLQKKYYRDPSNITNFGVIEGQPVNYNYFGESPENNNKKSNDDKQKNK